MINGIFEMDEAKVKVEEKGVVWKGTLQSRVFKLDCKFNLFCK